jgi:myo-inositol-1(or 4)-monophosphatase
MDLDYIKRTGIAAAYEGGKVLRSYFGENPEIRKKGATDLVTQADTESEDAIINTIRSRFPDHAFLGEESGLDIGSHENPSRNRWIIDPLDGTTNFAHKVGIFCVSIAFERDGEVVIGVVLDPLNGELFSAVAGEGAFMNGRPISVSTAASVKESLLATGFPYDLAPIFHQLESRFSICLENARGVRRLGSAALDLCYLACGRFDGFWEQNLHPWDTAAGLRIAEEAGARITDFSNQTFTIDKDEILATNGHIHTEMITLLKLEDV